MDILEKSINFCNEQLRLNDCTYSFTILKPKEVNELNDKYATDCYGASMFNIGIMSNYYVVVGTIAVDYDSNKKNVTIDSTCVFTLFRKMKISLLLRAAAFIFIYFLIEDGYTINYIESLAANPITAYTLQRWFGFNCSDDILPVCIYYLDDNINIGSSTNTLYIKSLYILDNYCH